MHTCDGCNASVYLVAFSSSQPANVHFFVQKNMQLIVAYNFDGSVLSANCFSEIVYVIVVTIHQNQRSSLDA